MLASGTSVLHFDLNGSYGKIYDGTNRHLLVLSLPMALAPSIYRADLADTKLAEGNVGRWGLPLVSLDTFQLLSKTLFFPIDRKHHICGKFVFGFG